MLQQDKKVLGIIFANMHDNMLGELTSVRTMGSIPYGGRYRLIDFPLSGMVNSGISNIGLITKFNYNSLMDHLGSGSSWDLARKNGGLHILPPFGHANNGLYRGKIEALGGIRGFIASSNANYVLLSDSNIIANIDCRAFIDAHISGGSQITVMYTCKKTDGSDNEDCTMLELDDANKITDVMCDVKTPGEYKMSVNVVIINRDFLIEIIDEFHSKGLYSFDRDFLQKLHTQYDMRGYHYKGLVMQINSIEQYYRANMALLDNKIREQLFIEERAIYTKVKDEAPAKYGLDSKVKNSLIADGCVIESTVENSVLFRGVHIKKGAAVKNCILMQDTVIEEGSTLTNVIADKNVTITENRTLTGAESYPMYINKRAVV